MRYHTGKTLQPRILETNHSRNEKKNLAIASIMAGLTEPVWAYLFNPRIGPRLFDVFWSTRPTTNARDTSVAYQSHCKRHCKKLSSRYLIISLNPIWIHISKTQIVLSKSDVEKLVWQGDSHCKWFWFLASNSLIYLIKRLQSRNHSLWSSLSPSPQQRIPSRTWMWLSVGFCVSNPVLHLFAASSVCVFWCTVQISTCLGTYRMPSPCAQQASSSRSISSNSSSHSC